MNHGAFGSDDPARDARDGGNLWTAFADGIFDVMPPDARIIDGCEHSYRYESSRGDWKGVGANETRKIDPQTWCQTLPGLEDMLLAIKSPAEFAGKRVAELKASGNLNPLNDNPECRCENGAIPASYEPWQGKKNRQGRLWGDSTCGEGDTFSLAAEGAENGAFSFGVAQKLIPDDRLLVTVSMKAKAAPRSSGNVARHGTGMFCRPCASASGSLTRTAGGAARPPSASPKATKAAG